ncbi:putative polyvalent protein kinase domain-containing protein [Spirosoma litoris]
MSVNKEREPTPDGRERYIPQRVPPAAERKNDQESLRAALDVIAGVHRASKAAQGPAPQNRAEKAALDQALRVGEEKLLRRWAASINKMIPADPFTDAWEAQGGEGGAEHQVYVQLGVYYKRNNLNYYGTWLSYLHNLLLHNWLFPETGYTFLGLMDVEGSLQSVVSQKALRGIRGATSDEVATYMLPFDFTPLQNSDYINTNFGIIVSDLHHRNVLVRDDGELLVFDPVIYLQQPLK